MTPRREPVFNSGDSVPADNIISTQPWYDPGFLVQSWCRGRFNPNEEADTIVLAWLMALDDGVSPAQAAERLLSCLGGKELPRACAGICNLLWQVAVSVRN